MALVADVFAPLLSSSSSSGGVSTLLVRRLIVSDASDDKSSSLMPSFFFPLVRCWIMPPGSFQLDVLLSLQSLDNSLSGAALQAALVLFVRALILGDDILFFVEIFCHY